MKKSWNFKTQRVMGMTGKKEDHEFKYIIDYNMSLMPTWSM